MDPGVTRETIRIPDPGIDMADKVVRGEVVVMHRFVDVRGVELLDLGREQPDGTLRRLVCGYATQQERTG